MKALKTMSENLELTCGALFDHHNHEIALHVSFSNNFPMQLNCILQKFRFKNFFKLQYREPVFGNLEGTHQDSIIPAIVAQ